MLGGDHSINIPCIAAFEGQEPFHVVHIDAHLDFVDERHGVRHGHGNLVAPRCGEERGQRHDPDRNPAMWFLYRTRGVCPGT
ncbi:arginase family protein [Cupriavidus basilensis]